MTHTLSRHDLNQVTLGGAVHALEPLKYAFAPGQVLMISEPVICMGALWIPYRRDTQLMKAILSQGVKHAHISSDTTLNSGTHFDSNGVDGSDVTSSSSPSSSISIIFCHADVRGAFMNDGARCRDGLDIAEFPRDLPIYSGHFHKPHIMSRGRSSLRYVGSPYQTSLSEAGQDKFLYCMQTKTSTESRVSSTSSTNHSPVVTWSEYEPPWRLDIGRKHYKALSLNDPVVRVARPYTLSYTLHQHIPSISTQPPISIFIPSITTSDLPAISIYLIKPLSSLNSPFHLRHTPVIPVSPPRCVWRVQVTVS